jgi:membrane fusion protein (multidrug efflux system)
MTDPEPNHKKRNRVMLVLALIFATCGLALFLIWWLWWQFEVYTDDAYVSGNTVMLSPQVSGIVRSINCDETDFVCQDQILVELDTTDFMIALQKSQEMLGNEVREVVKLFERVDELGAEIEIKTADLVRAELDFNHREALVESGGVSLEDYQHALIALDAAAAAAMLVEHQFNAAFAEVENTTVETHPRVLQAAQQFKQAWVNLNRCNLASPATGMVAQRTVQVGKSINPGDSLLWIVPLDQLWVEANFKEVQLQKLRIGQPVSLRADIYGSDVTYHGTVVGIGAATGSVFSVLPPQNATGNWIKIVQRLPVRIAFDPGELKDHPLRLGLSMEVKVDIHDLKGRCIAESKPLQPVYETTVYQNQERGAQEIIDAIINMNRGSF